MVGFLSARDSDDYLLQYYHHPVDWDLKYWEISSLDPGWAKPLVDQCEKAKILGNAFRESRRHREKAIVRGLD